MIDPSALQNVVGAFNAVVQFRSDFETHRAEFPTFLSRNLLGVAPDLLRAPLDHLAASQGILAPLQPVAVQATIGASHQAVTTVFRDLLNAVSGMDPADLNSYTQIDGQLGALATAIGSLSDATTALYTRTRAPIDAHPWDSLFAVHRQLLEAVTIEDVPTVDDVTHSMAGILEGVLARLQSIFGPQDLARRIDRLSQSIQELFLSSPLGQVHRAMRDFLEDIRRASTRFPPNRSSRPSRAC